MSTSSSTVEHGSKFTRGEKCLFLHIVITFCLIIAIVIAYYGHACLVRHRGNLGVSLSRRAGDASSESSNYRCVGAVYVKDGQTDRAACASVLISTLWSLAAARCVTARSRPALAHLLPYWTVRYEASSTGTAGIRRGMAHPSFDADDAANDVGLFEHETEVTAITPCNVPAQVIGEDLSNEDDLHIIGHSREGVRWSRRVHGVQAARCAHYTAPVVERRVLCVAADTMRRAGHTSLLDGVLFTGGDVAGLPSWGAGVDGYPLVVVDIALYKDWFNFTMINKT